MREHAYVGFRYAALIAAAPRERRRALNPATQPSRPAPQTGHRGKSGAWYRPARQHAARDAPDHRGNRSPARHPRRMASARSKRAGCLAAQASAAATDPRSAKWLRLMICGGARSISPAQARSKRRLRREPHRLGGFALTVLRHLTGGRHGHKEPRVKALAHHRRHTRRHPARPGQQRRGGPGLAHRLHGLQKVVPPAPSQPRIAPTASACRPEGAPSTSPHSSKVSRNAAAYRPSASAVGKLRLIQGLPTGLRPSGPTSDSPSRLIGRVHLATRKHMGTAQHTRIGMAAHHQHLQPLRPHRLRAPPSRWPKAKAGCRQLGS